MFLWEIIQPYFLSMQNTWIHLLLEQRRVQKFK